MRKLIKAIKARIDRYGYPIVVPTAPKTYASKVKVDVHDPAYFRPLSELKKQRVKVQNQITYRDRERNFVVIAK